MNKILIILEMANNHMGDFSHAKKIIDSFFILKKKYSREVNFAFKYQFRDINTFINNDYAHFNKKGVDRFVSTKFDSVQWLKLIKYTKESLKYGKAVRAAAEVGFGQKEIADAAYVYQKEMEAGESILVGVNKFTQDKEPFESLFSVQIQEICLGIH